MSKNRYYISSGALNRLYTLRVEFDEPTYYHSEHGPVSTGVIARDHYVMTLSADPQVALAKAKAYLAGSTSGQAIQAPDFELGEIRRGEAVDWNVFHGGKHAGKTVEWVVQNDPDYAIWAAENMSGDRYAGTVEILQHVLAPVLAERSAERQKKETARAEAQAKIGAILAPLAERLADGQRGFCDSVAEGLRRGVLPSGKGLNIMLDILAKNAGRRNSNAYDDEYERVLKIVDEVNAIIGPEAAR